MTNKLEDFFIQKHENLKKKEEAFLSKHTLLRKAQIHFEWSGGSKLVNLSLRNTEQALQIQLKELTESI